MDASTLTAVAAIIAAIGAAAAAVIGAINGRISKDNTRILKDVATQANGMHSALMEKQAALSHNEGVTQGVAQEKQAASAITAAVTLELEKSK